MEKIDLLTLFNKTPDEIIKYFNSLGIMPADGWEQVNLAIGQDCFGIAGVKNMDDLLLAKDLIADALKREIPLKEFKNTLKEKLNLKAWHSSLVVSQNISNAYAAGRYDSSMVMAEDFPFLRPIVTLDSRTTDSCKWLKTANICFRTNDPDLYKMYPPRHFKCRVVFVSITQRQADRYGLSAKKISEIPSDNWNDKPFRRVPTAPIMPVFNLNKYPKELVKEFNKELV